MNSPLNKKLNTVLLFRTILLLLIALAVNIALGHLMQFVLKTPLFLDSIGTILIGALLGPLAGALVGAFSNVIWYFILGDQSILPYAITAAFIGWAAGIVFSINGILPRPIVRPIPGPIMPGPKDNGIRSPGMNKLFSCRV